MDIIKNSQETNQEIQIHIDQNEQFERSIIVTIPEEFACKLFSSKEQMERKLQRSAIISCKTTENFSGQLAVIREGLLIVSLFTTLKDGKRIYTLCGLPDKTDSYFNLIKKICLSFYDEKTPYSAL